MADLVWDEYTGSFYDPDSPTTNIGTENDQSNYWANYINSQLNSTPLPAGSQDIDKDLASWTSKGINLKDIGKFAKKLLTGEGSVKDYATTLAGVAGLYELINKDRAPKSWAGTLTKPSAGAFVSPQMSQAYQEAILSRPYGSRAMGMNPFAVDSNTFAMLPEGVKTLLPRPAPETRAAEGGAISMAKGGHLEAGAFILPADVISHFGNGSSEAGLEFAEKHLGAVPIKGKGDGMSDSISTTIEGKQPARVANEEAMIPRDKVTSLGGGDNKKGTKVLYNMMDRVRKARTGTKKQGKKINPAKFAPGGIAGYADGGAVAFQTGGTTVNAGGSGGTLAGGLSPWVGDYVAGPEGFLTKAWALGDRPYQAYTGPLTAGVSPLQQQAFTGLSNLGTPGQFGTATQFATQAGQTAGGLGYTPSGMPSFGQVTSGYQAPAAYQTGQFTNQFTAPGAYEAAKFNTGLGALGSVQDYMNQYTSGVTDISAREARRQADIGRQSEQARLSQAGAYGGSRQAIMEAERQRNLNQQIEDISTKGLQSAYDNALKQRYQEAGLGLQAQEAGERSRQFGAQQGMQGAQLGAQFGLEAQRAGEQSRQFGAQQGLTAAEQAARFGLTAQQANQQADLEAARQAESSRQFGAKYGLEGLGQQLQAAQLLGSLGSQQQQSQLSGLQALLGAGGTQQAAEQAAIDAQIKQFQEAQMWPYKQLQFQQSMLQGLPVSTSTTTPNTSMYSDLMSGVGGLLDLYKKIPG
jgi:hypothetical protein